MKNIVCVQANYCSFVVFQVYVVRKRQLFGPLIPQEIKDLVIAKYREVNNN